jgi:UDP-N-acetylmuramoyl-tripeptide--D-alanyl-D-alanine ligase
MIPLSLAEIAAVVGGTVEGDGAVTVTAPTMLDGAGERALALAGNDAAVDWLRGHLAAGDVVLVKASRAARLNEVAALA